MNTINIKIVVDATSLAQSIQDGAIKPGTKDVPVFLGSYDSSNAYIVIISPYGTNRDNIKALNLKQSELFACNCDDTIQWTITSFSNNYEHSVFLYNLLFNPSKAMSPVTFNSFQIKNYLPSEGGTTPGLLTEYINQIATVQATTEQVSLIIQYNFSFQLIENSTGNVIGYFYWDSTLKIN